MGILHENKSIAQMASV